MKEYSKFYQNLEIRNIDHNNIGIFTNKDIKKGQIIEFAPVISNQNKPETFNKNAIFTKNKYWLIMLGYGSIYRIFYKDFNTDIEIPDDLNQDSNKFITIRANQDIRQNEEIILDAKYFGLDIKNISQYYQNIYYESGLLYGKIPYIDKLKTPIEDNKITKDISYCQ